MTERDLVYASVDSIDGHTASIRFEELEPAGQSVTVPLRCLPRAVRSGDRVVVEFLTADGSADQRDSTARKLLEDILNGQ